MRKREFTSFDVAAVIRELKESVADCRVSNIYQLDSNTFLFKLHKPDKPDLRLVLESGRRFHLTSYLLEKPKVPPGFCMVLRRYLRNGWLTSVAQHEFERVVVFSFRAGSGVLRVVLELFAEGNVVLVDEKGKILQALHYKRMRDRDVVRGEEFRFAPPSGMNPLKMGKAELQEALRSSAGVEIVRVLARFLGIGGFYAEEVLLRAGIDKTKLCSALSDVEVDGILDNVDSMVSEVSEGKLEPSVVLDADGSFLDVVPVRLRCYEGFKHVSYASFNEALDEFYVRVTAVEKATAGVELEELRREAERFKRIIGSQEKAMADAKTEAERDKRVGDVIYAYAGELQVLIDKFLREKEGGKNWNVIVSEVSAEKKAGQKPDVFFEGFDARNLAVNVCVDGLSFGLGLRERLVGSAARYYERSKRARQKLEGAKVALEETRKKMSEVEEKIRKAEALERVASDEVAEEELAERRVRHKEWFEKFRWFVSSDGFLVVAGKDAVSNEVLIKKHTDAEDVVFHADVVGAPFVVVKTEGKHPSESVLREAGEFAAAFSRGWREGFGSVDVYWVKPEQLSKGGPSGESVPRGGFVVRGVRNWMRNVPLRVSVGVSVNEEEGHVRLGGGPVDAVKAKANAYAVVVPGDVEGKELFKRVLKSLAARLPKEAREVIREASVEAIREYIPFGKGRVLTE